MSKTSESKTILQGYIIQLLQKKKYIRTSKEYSDIITYLNKNLKELEKNDINKTSIPVMLLKFLSENELLFILLDYMSTRNLYEASAEKYDKRKNETRGRKKEILKGINSSSTKLVLSSIGSLDYKFIKPFTIEYLADITYASLTKEKNKIDTNSLYGRLLILVNNSNDRSEFDNIFAKYVLTINDIKKKNVITRITDIYKNDIKKSSKVLYYIKQILCNNSKSPLKTQQLLNQLPYIIEYNKKNESLFKLLCILQTHSKDYLTRLDQYINDESITFLYNSFDDQISKLPLFPYKVLLTDMKNSKVEHSLELTPIELEIYLYFFVRHVLLSHLYYQLWSNMILLILKSIHMIDYNSIVIPKTITISLYVLNDIKYVLVRLNTILEEEYGIYTEFNTIIDSILKESFPNITATLQTIDNIDIPITTLEELQSIFEVTLNNVLMNKLTLGDDKSLFIKNEGIIKKMLQSYLSITKKVSNTTNSIEDGSYLENYHKYHHINYKRNQIGLFNDRKLIECIEKLRKNYNDDGDGIESNNTIESVKICHFQSTYNIILDDLYDHSHYDHYKMNNMLNLLLTDNADDYDNQLRIKELIDGLVFKPVSYQRGKDINSDLHVSLDTGMTINDVKTKFTLLKERFNPHINRKVLQEEGIVQITYLESYHIIYEKNALDRNYLDLTHIKNNEYDTMIVNNTTRITILILYKQYQYRILKPTERYHINYFNYATNTPKDTIQLIIQTYNVVSSSSSCNDGNNIYQLSHSTIDTLEYQHNNTIELIIKNRSYILDSLLDINEKNVTQFTPILDEKLRQIKILIVVNHYITATTSTTLYNSGNNDEDAFISICTIRDYQSRFNRVKPDQIPIYTIEDKIIVPGDEEGEEMYPIEPYYEEEDKKVYIYSPDLRYLSEEEEDEDEEDDYQKSVNLVYKYFAEYRYFIIASREEFNKYKMERGEIPYITSDNKIAVGHLRSFKRSLFGGLILLTRTLYTEDTIEFNIEFLIRKIERYIEGNREHMRNYINAHLYGKGDEEYEIKRPKQEEGEILITIEDTPYAEEDNNHIIIDKYHPSYYSTTTKVKM